MSEHVAAPRRNEKAQSVPLYWELLSESDKSGYHNLKMAFNVRSIKRNRGRRVETFDSMLEAIHKYAERHDTNDWRRFLVCGVCWMDGAIAINTRQLRLLITKCKSSINGSLQKLGYVTNTSHSESWNMLFSRIPTLRDNFTEIRQWTIRYKKDMNPTSVPVQPQFLPKVVLPPEAMRRSVPAIHLPKLETRAPNEQEPVLPLKFRHLGRV